MRLFSYRGVVWGTLAYDESTARSNSPKSACGHRSILKSRRASGFARSPRENFRTCTREILRATRSGRPSSRLGRRPGPVERHSRTGRRARATHGFTETLHSGGTGRKGRARIALRPAPGAAANRRARFLRTGRSDSGREQRNHMTLLRAASCLAVRGHCPSRCSQPVGRPSPSRSVRH